MSDWFSQRQSDGVIYAKADGLRSALEEATRLGEVTDMESAILAAGWGSRSGQGGQVTLRGNAE